MQVCGWGQEKRLQIVNTGLVVAAADGALGRAQSWGHQEEGVMWSWVQVGHCGLWQSSESTMWLFISLRTWVTESRAVLVGGHAFE